MRSLDSILDLLHQHHQRATYGAVAGLVGGAPRSLMQGRKKCWRDSWVVNQEAGLPSEYSEPLIHPDIRERQEILMTAAELEAWLGNPH